MSAGFFQALSSADDRLAELESLRAECARLRAEVASLTSMCASQSLELQSFRLDRRGW